MQGFKVYLKHNAHEVAGNLRAFERKQVPFATAKAINDTLFDIRPALISNWNMSFPGAKNKGFARAALRVERANKHSLKGVVYDQLQTDWMLRQATGGIKSARGGVVAIPQYGRGKLRRTRWGPAAGQKAKEIIGGNPNYFSGKPKGHPHAPAGIYRRLPRSRRTKGGLRLVYVYKREVFVEQQFDGYEVAETTTARRFPVHFRKSLARALATAK